ncbi:g10656 [Coccomyxa viridis]|uniref:G10656 protein n=1 Tax=Coccomyxa viridis TaxID=1274662 RepID=A0ABP1G8G3_9CHLO
MHHARRGQPWQVQAALKAPHSPQENSAPEKAEARGSAVRAAKRLAAAALASLQIAVVPFAANLVQPAPAAAVLNSPNARIARSADAALRRSIPAFNKDVREVQQKLEDVAFKLRIPQRKPWPAMVDDVRGATSIVTQPDRVMYGVPTGKEEEAQALTKNISSGLRGVMGAIDAKDADKVSRRIADVLKDVASLEILQAPGLTFKIPELFSSIPRLTGRATVELIIERKGSPEAYVTRSGGGPVPQARIGITLDGYSAPLTAGSFAANVQDGVYDGKPVNASYASVLAGRGAIPGKVLPLEILPLGEFDPVYRSTLDIQNGELPVLPLSIYGAVAMAHAPADEAPLPDGYSVSDEFFVYKFSKEQAGLSGLAFDEGIFSVFGYVTEGIELVQQLQSDDVIVSSRLLTGAERLVRPQ